MTDTRSKLLSYALRAGPACLAIGSGAVALALSFYWAAESHGSFLIGLLMLLFGLVPCAAIAGAVAGLVFGPLAQWLAGALRIASMFWPLVHAAALGIFAFLTALPLAAWVAGGASAALSGRQGAYVLLVPVAIAGAIAGALFGVATWRYETALSAGEGGG